MKKGTQLLFWREGLRRIGSVVPAQGGLFGEA